jgi:hypothetical protein
MIIGDAIRRNRNVFGMERVLKELIFHWLGQWGRMGRGWLQLVKGLKCQRVLRDLFRGLDVS